MMIVVVVVVVVVHILNTILGEVGELVDSTLPGLTGTVLLLDLREGSVDFKYFIVDQCWSPWLRSVQRLRAGAPPR